LLEFRIVQVLAFGSVIYLHAAGEGDLWTHLEGSHRQGRDGSAAGRGLKRQMTSSCDRSTVKSCEQQRDDEVEGLKEIAPAAS
jgi:hypothetical protein